MVRQITPSAPSLPPTSAIKDPAVRSFASAVAEVLRVLRSTPAASSSGGLTEAQVRKLISEATPRTSATPVSSGGVTRAYEPADPRLQIHLRDTENPHATTAAQAGADPAGTAAAAMTAHEGASDPHPQYITSSEVAAELGPAIHGASSEAWLIASDELPFVDPTGTPVLTRITWTNFKASIKAYLDSVYAAIGTIGSSGLTMSSGKLLGRSSASSGAIEEITLGTGLTLSAGVLSAGGGGGFTFSSTAPASPTEGHRWVHADTLIEYTYINDGNSLQWIEV